LSHQQEKGDQPTEPLGFFSRTVDFGIYLIPVFQVHIAGVDDVVSKVLWMNLFIEAQNIKVNTNIIYQA
jgi:hypothetical protein